MPPPPTPTINPPVTVTLADGAECDIPVMEARHLLRVRERIVARKLRDLKRFSPRDNELFLAITNEEYPIHDLLEHVSSDQGAFDLAFILASEALDGVGDDEVERLIDSADSSIVREILASCLRIGPAEDASAAGSDPPKPAKAANGRPAAVNRRMKKTARV